ncbi:AAA family ATPase [Cellulomonas soli]
MLALKKLTVRDFGPYRGLQEISFSRENGVYIVYGDNGRGKTTLHNAFRYALYGEILGRRRAESARDLANSEARKLVGFGSFETVLDFDHNGVGYRLTRRYDESRQPSELGMLERAGSPLSQDDMTASLREIAPPSVSQFFLFDGELLRQYENLLDEDSDEGAALEQSIERVLGIPVVANAAADVREVGRSASKQLAQQYAAHDETARLGLALNEAQVLREKYQEDRAAVVERLESSRDKVSELEAQLRMHQKAERLLGSLDQLRGRNRDLDSHEREALSSLAEVSADVWKAVLAPSAEVRLAVVDGLYEEAERARRDIAAASRDLVHLQHESDCPVCRQQVSDETRLQLTTALEATLDASSTEALEGRIARLRLEQRTLQALARHDGRLIAERDKSVRSIRLEHQEVREDIAGVEQELAEVGEDQLRLLTAERDERQIQIANDKERLEASDRKITEQETAIENLKRRLREQNVRADPTIEAKDQVSQKLEHLFHDAIDVYRAELRARVEDQASRTFKTLASEPEYERLRITDRYGLQIIDSEGEVVRRSAGYEHLVALSLIAALQDSAAVRGPVIMDYPFGRLDASNTARVVAALPRMARQVVLLSFDGEFDRDVALAALGPDLVAEYALERVTSKHTTIRRRANS